jgi:ribonucleotide monophosphatase NagD (HAD superfamily)
MKPFNEGLKTVYTLIYKKDLLIEIYGKPHVNAFAYAEKQIENLYGKVEKMVMVGDNVEADIECPI